MGQKATKYDGARSKVNNAFFSSANFLRALGGVFFTIRSDHWRDRIQTESTRCQKLHNLPDTYKLQLDDGIAVVTLLHPEDLAQLTHLPPALNQAINSREDHFVFQVIQFDLHPESQLEEPKSTDSALRSCLPRDSFGPSSPEAEAQPQEKTSWWQWLKNKSPQPIDEDQEADSDADSGEQSEDSGTLEEYAEVESASPPEEERLPPSATLRKRLQESLESDDDEEGIDPFRSMRESCSVASPESEVKSPEPTALCVTVANEVEPPTWVRRLDNFKEDVESGTSEEEVEESMPRRKDSQNLPAEWTHFDLGTSSSEPSPLKSATDDDERKENDKEQHSRQQMQSPLPKDARGKRRPQRPTSSPNQVIKRPRRDANKTPASKAPPTPSKNKKQTAPKSVTRSAKPTPCRSAKKKRTRVLQNDDEEEQEAIL